MGTWSLQLCTVLEVILLGLGLGLSMSTVSGLKLENVHVPIRALVGADADLYCYFSLENNTLWSLKWFKDGMEFSRYIPKQAPATSLYFVDGVNVDSARSNLNRIHLRNLTESSSGIYRCEVATTSPFRIDNKQSEMDVIAGPPSDPELVGFPSSVAVGDKLQGDCTLPGGISPVPTLTFYINNQPVTEADVTINSPTVFNSGRGTQSLESVRLSLEVKDTHWTSSGGSSNFNFLELKCVATMEDIDMMWVKVTIIQESHPTLRRAPLQRRQQNPVSRPTAQALVQQRSSPAIPNSNTVTNRTQITQPLDTACEGSSSSQLFTRIVDLLASQNEALDKLSNIENQRLEIEKESLSLRRQELAFLKGLQRPPIKTN